MKAVIVFQKNFDYGKVKTRLAATIGNENAMLVYKKLVEQTHQSLKQLIETDIYLFFSDRLDDELNYGVNYFYEIQSGNNLGERMQHAFTTLFEKKYTEVIIIGTDCPFISQDLFNKAFDALKNKQHCIGPAIDGGYYLLGLHTTFFNVFKNKNWSTDTVAADTINDFKKNNQPYYVLSTLSDIDEEKDLTDDLKKLCN